MSRLFITPREINLVNDIIKEVTRDIVGQKIYFYSISSIKSNVHKFYLEAPKKIFDNPVILNCLVDMTMEQEVRTNSFGYETFYSVKAYIQSRDMIDSNVLILPGDFFTYGELIFEITSVKNSDSMFGQVEYSVGIELTGKQSRKSNFTTRVLGPTGEAYTDPGAVQDEFYQHRGFENNAEGPTGDVRELQRNGTLDTPLGKSEVSIRGSSGSAGSSFYDES